MTHNADPGKEVQEADQQLLQGLALLGRAGVGGMTLGIETAFVADAYRAAVEGTAVGTHLQQTAVLCDLTVATDVEVIAYGTETTGTVVALQLADGIVLVGTGGAAVQDEVTHAFDALHAGTGLMLLQELTFADDFVVGYKDEVGF